MTAPALQSFVIQTLNYADLPEVWRIPESGRFSAEKTLYDYQEDALRNAARALFLYYGNEHDWVSGESDSTNKNRKRYFARLYQNLPADVRKYEGRADARNDNQNPVFKILADYVAPPGDVIQYDNFINRMCFWMATGSGKTLVMVKLIEYLCALQKHAEIPPHNILVLAPSEHLLGQIRRTVDEFNQFGLHIDLVPLREIHRTRQARLGDAVTVYYHRSDNISDVQKEALTNYREYENHGKWYVLLDEAHKGGKENSKRQAYYAVMAREGFLFNFSATFTDAEDIVTTVKKYNLEEFIKNGHGKNIYLNQTEYDAFRNRQEEISHLERRKIVLKSLITLSYISRCVTKLRTETGIENLYHRPLMLTLVNSVNTDVENERNDLWAFFQILREIATGMIEKSLFGESKAELITDWKNAALLFHGDGGGIIGIDESSIRKISIHDLREAIFLNRRRGALQFIRSGDNRELAFQMRNADSPFALIRIGDTSMWRNQILAGYEETTALQEGTFFENLEKSPITILMGSRSFFESWDSNRPNVINFINIGGKDAKKFVVQSVGRGVRIETLPNQRRRFAYLPPSEVKTKILPFHDRIQPPETLFLFATNRGAVKQVLEGLESEKGYALEKLEGFERAMVPKIGGKAMPLLVPGYKEAGRNGVAQAPFALSEDTLTRFEGWLGKTSDSVFAVRDGLEENQISALRGMVEQSARVRIQPEKNYAKVSFLQSRLVSHLSHAEMITDGVREVNDADIVHFRQIRVRREYTDEIQRKISSVKRGRASDEEISELGYQLAKKEITRQIYDDRALGKSEDFFKDLTIKKLLGHYYLPVVLGNETASYIQHIIKVESEINFLNDLGKYVGGNEVGWDAWMFSKIDETLDDVHIPYYDVSKNEYRRFMPDFIFWMSRGNDYQIVFVDPKSAVYTGAEHRIDGYCQLFNRNEVPRVFNHGKIRVRVKLLMYNEPATAPKLYRSYWSHSPADIFRAAQTQHPRPR